MNELTTARIGSSRTVHLADRNRNGSLSTLCGAEGRRSIAIVKQTTGPVTCGRCSQVPAAKNFS